MNSFVRSVRKLLWKELTFTVPEQYKEYSSALSILMIYPKHLVH